MWVFITNGELKLSCAIALTSNPSPRVTLKGALVHGTRPPMECRPRQQISRIRLYSADTSLFLWSWSNFKTNGDDGWEKNNLVELRWVILRNISCEMCNFKYESMLAGICSSELGAWLHHPVSEQLSAESTVGGLYAFITLNQLDAVADPFTHHGRSIVQWVTGGECYMFISPASNKLKVEGRWVQNW